MGIRYNPFSGTLDFVGIQGPASSTDTAIVSWNGTSGGTVQDNPNALVQSGGALQAQGFVFNRQILNNVTVPPAYTMINTDVQIVSGDIILNSDAELLLL